MIERWFPCEEVSRASGMGWGTGNTEANLFPWFAKRPLAQAKAAVICSLLPWPAEAPEQDRLQALVRRSLVGEGRRPPSYDEAHDELVEELEKRYPDGATVVDPFSGRAMIPVEAARLGVMAWGIDISPVATLGGLLLADYPLRSWDEEPPLPYPDYQLNPIQHRLLNDVEYLVGHIGRRFEQEMDPFYPRNENGRAWGYLWAASLPCQECGNRFPLTGSLRLRFPIPRMKDPGQSYRLVPNLLDGTFHVEVHDGDPSGAPTLVTPAGQSRHSSKGKVAVCLFCDQPHDKSLCERLARERLARDELLVAADLDPTVGKRFRLPTTAEREGVLAAKNQLAKEPDFGPRLPAIPREPIPDGNTWTVQPSVFGARTYGELCNDRQTLGFIRLCRMVRQVGDEILEAGVSPSYGAALTGYLGAALARKLRRSTRGASLQVSIDGRGPRHRIGVHDIFGSSESSISFSWDYFEAGIGEGPGSWRSVASDTVTVLRRQLSRALGRPAHIERGSAVTLPFRDSAIAAIVTDPPYDSMIDYADASDLFYVWLKRALPSTHPDLAVTSDPSGLQEKFEEIIVKKGGAGVRDHRNQQFYDHMLTRAFSEASRCVSPDGVVTIVFGHGDPEVWHRLLTALSAAGLVLTGSWPARTERGGTAGSANIVTTLTLACRPAPLNRRPGRVSDVDAEVRRVIKDRLALWEGAGLALTDQLMASAGPAMEVVGRYSVVLDKKGNPVELDRYLPLARRAVEEAADIKIDSLPLGTFDARTRFALFWARVNGRSVAPASEARWQRLASDLTEADTAGILVAAEKGVRLAQSSQVGIGITESSAVIDVALAVARRWREDGLAGAAEVLVEARRADDPYLWAAIGELSRVVPESDPDGQAWTSLVRNRSAMGSAARQVVSVRAREEHDREVRDRQGNLFG